MNMKRYLTWLSVIWVVSAVPPAFAQWLTQTNSLRPGWNSVFLHVDASHTTVDALVTSDPFSPIQEVWYWQPALPTGQFVDTPQQPSTAGNQWIQWTRSLSTNAPLQRCAGNGAYLVYVAGGLGYDWKVPGKPVLPLYKWTLTGLNFIGFPVSPTAAPTFESFLAKAPGLQQTAEIYRYQGGEFGNTNPARLFAYRTAPVRRDQAYWVRAGETDNQYFGPIRILQADPIGLRFGTTRGQQQFRIRNVANVPVTVEVNQIASETPPLGQPAIAGLPPLLLRGALNTNNLTFGYTNLSAGPFSWTLAAVGQPGSEVEVAVGLNRSAMDGTPGSLFASILRFTDSFGLSRVDMPVSAEKASPAGLWVGGAVVSYVSHYLKPYARATNELDFAALLERLQLAEGVNGYHYEWDPSTGRVLVFGGPENKTGSYLLEGPIKVDSGTVAEPYPLRLILHHNGAATRLFQKIFIGPGLGTNTVITTRENLLLASQLSSARRISAVHLPTSADNTPWNCAGSLQPGASLSVTVPVSYDDQASNPFLHTYHPDHDNLDAQFASTLPRGSESFGLSRQITLNFTAPEDHFNGLTAGTQDLSGTYLEVITIQAKGSNARQYQVTGSFSLKRISDIAALTTP
jgi:hypothetical protein